MLVPVFFTLCSFLYVNGVDAEPATITRAAKRAEETLDTTIIGYSHTGNNRYEKFDCRSGSAWQTSSDFGRCCPTSRGSDCFMATDCVDGSILINAAGSSTCSGSVAQTKCVTGTVFRTVGDSTPLMNYQCWPQWDGGNWEATRITTTTDPTASASPSSSPSSPVSATSSETSPTSTGAPTETPSSSSSSSSTGAIAGGVVGGVAGIAIIGFAGFWFWRRRRATNDQLAGGSQMPLDPYGQPQGVGTGYQEEKFAYAHMGAPAGVSGSHAPVEMQGNDVFEAQGMGTQAPVEADGNAVPNELDHHSVPKR